MHMPKPIAFFDTQFQRQVRESDFALNPFEQLALDYVAGTVLDYGCGLGNLTHAAARRGSRVVAVDASPTAVERIRATAAQEKLAVEASGADLSTHSIERSYDTIVAIGLLMFFRRERALALLADIQANVAAGGCAIVNVLIEGTTYLGMFDPDNYYLFGRDELEQCFAGWKILVSRHDSFPAPGDMRKEFSTVIARR
jgi:tellurite methyltransferase